MRVRRLLTALAAAALLAGPATQAGAQRSRAPAQRARTPAVTDWTRVAVRTPDGVRLGNPAARVKLVEYGSITCPHCAHFASEGTAPLYGHVRTGRVSWEYRPYMLFPTDPALFALLNCQAPGAFFPTVERLYATQRTWVTRVQTWLEANREQVLAMAGPARATALFRASQVDGLFRGHGMTPAQINACIGNVANLRRVAEGTQRASQRNGVTGTPTFFVNGVRAENVGSWADLEPLLVRAGAR